MLFRSNDTATTEIYTLSLHDALPILPERENRSLHRDTAAANWDEVSSGQVWTYWILNVHGQRMVLVGVCDTTCNEQDLKTLNGMATSVTFERTGERR